MALNRRSMLFVLLILLLVAAPSAALAANPHFIYAKDSVNSAGALVVAFKEAGLGGGQTITYRLSSDASAVYGCVNRGGNRPRAGNKTSVVGPVAASIERTAAKNGQITATIVAGPLPPPLTFSCPPGQSMVLVSVSYADVVLTDTTNGVWRVLPDVARTFWP